MKEEKVSRDSLGDRMKAQYENRTRFSLPRRTYTIIRCDGKAFHSIGLPLAIPNSRKVGYALICVACGGAMIWAFVECLGLQSMIPNRYVYLGLSAAICSSVAGVCVAVMRATYPRQDEPTKEYEAMAEPPKAPRQFINAPGGIAIGGGVVTNATVNNYGPTPRRLTDEQRLAASRKINYAG